MDQPKEVLPNGTVVKTHAELESEDGMFVSPLRLARRRPNMVGKIWGIVPGTGGDVYWVLHDSDDPDDHAPYCFTEFELHSGVPSKGSATVSDRSELENAEALLVRLTERLPPPEGCHHGLVVIDGKLKVTVARPGGEKLTQWQVVNFDDGDFDKSIDTLVDEIVGFISAQPPA